MLMRVVLDGQFVGTVTEGRLPKVVFNTADAVQDEVRGYLVYNNGWTFCDVQQYKPTYNKKLKKLALILESPHKDEYDNNFKPVRPANGRTGNNICTKIYNRNFTFSLNCQNDYEVFLINPVQLQCSCYHQFARSGVVLTDEEQSKNTAKVFRRLYSAKGGNLRRCFMCRLRSYQPDVAVICTTSSVKSIVHTAIKSCMNHNLIYSDKHPSRW